MNILSVRLVFVKSNIKAPITLKRRTDRHTIALCYYMQCMYTDLMTSKTPNYCRLFLLLIFPCQNMHSCYTYNVYARLHILHTKFVKRYIQQSSKATAFILDRKYSQRS